MYNKKTPIAIGLVLSLFGIYIFGELSSIINLFSDSYLKQVIFSDFRKWFIIVLVLLIIIYWEKRTLSSIGFKKISIKTVLQSILLGIIAVVISILTLGILYNVIGLKEPDTLSTIAELPLLVKLFTITTAAITEEILYRGYSIERIRDMSGSIIIGGLISGFIFLAMHFPDWGIAGAIPQIIFTIFLIGYYIKKRNLLACIIMHWVINFMMIIILPSII